MSLIELVKSRTPHAVRRLSRRLKQELRNSKNKHRTTEEVFTEIYEKKLWGVGVEMEAETEFFSGPGSGSEAAAAYAGFVNSFIAEHGINSVVDLGCGDFRVGRLIASSRIDYHGIDVVRPLIAANTKLFGSDRISFTAMDIVEGKLPDGDLCLVREVLQHLSNAQIKSVLGRLQQYRYVLVTDIQPGPVGSFKCNKDKTQGAGSRILSGSGLRLDQSPFNVKDVELVLETTPPYFTAFSPYGTKIRLRTFLLRH